MTPPARLAAAIAVLDAIIAGAPAEQALTNWGRGSRYAGSGDRAAVRDHVFDALRCRRSFAALGGGGDRETGRALILGGLRAAAVDPELLFKGSTHAPAARDAAERALTLTLADLPQNVALDCPDWLAPMLRADLADDFVPVMQALRHRAPLFVRVNPARATIPAVIAALAAAGIAARPHPLADTALEISGNPRGLTATAAFADGWFELQDAASQAVVAMLPLVRGSRVLDFCAGGGGKTLAMAAHPGLRVFAHDASPARMRDLPVRAARAGVAVTVLDPDAVARAAPFDLILLDVPCSGSGAWRRNPDAKWALTAAGLAELSQRQTAILDTACAWLGPGGTLAYVTCSLLRAENQLQTEAFARRNPGWEQVAERVLTPTAGGDGFYVALMRRRAP